MRNLSPIFFGIIIGLLLGRILWNTHLPAPQERVVETPIATEAPAQVQPETIPAVASAPNLAADKGSSCNLRDFPLSELKAAYDAKNDVVTKSIVLARFPPAKTEIEKEERRKAFAPEVAELARESQYWSSEWSTRLGSQIVSMTIVWSVHDDGDGFGFEIFLPDGRQALAMGAGLTFATPARENRYVVTSLDDRDIDPKISHFAFGLPTTRTRFAPSEYLVPNENSWREGPQISWRPISKTHAENLRKDAAKRAQANER